MPEIHFKAFLSCSFTDDDKDVVEFFQKIIESFDIDTVMYDYQEIGGLSDKVKENIINSDCMIAIATKRHKIEGSDSWSCSDWIQHEIALANAYEKPIAVFIEEGVKMDGIIAMEKRQEIFNRNNLIKRIDKINKFIFKLRNHMESSFHSGLSQMPILLRHYIHTKEQMVSKDIVVIRTEILMESLVDALDGTHHSIAVEESTPGLSIRPKEFTFKCLEKPLNTVVETSNLIDTDQRYSWKISFNPPLKRGERVKYAFKSVIPNCRPYTYEDLMQRIQNKTYEYSEPICEACEWQISYPTYEFHHEFEFPEDYEIGNYYSDVSIGDAKLKAENEAKRIKDGNMFVADKNFDKWLLKLKVIKPLQNHVYYTYYVPPKMS